MLDDSAQVNIEAMREPLPAVRPRVAGPANQTATAPLAGSLAAWRSRLLPALVTLLVFVNYLYTLAPSVLDADAGRFQAKAYTLGIGHPTGYPTFIMLGKLFTYLPAGDVAYRVNLSSAVYATLASLLLFLIARRLAGPFPAVVATLAFAVGRAYWSQAVVAEVYTLNVLFLCAIVYTLLRWRDRRSDRLLLLAAFLMGLTLTNHMTSGLLIPAGALFALLVDRSLIHRPRLIASALGLFLLGLSPYTYLPIRASMDPPMNYGDPSNLRNFLYLVRGGRYGASMWAFGPLELPGRLWFFGGELLKQVSIPALLPFSLVGFVSQWRRDREAWALFALPFFGMLIYALEYDIWDIWVYFIPVYLGLALWAALGIRVAMTRLAASPRLLRAALPGALLLAMAASWGANLASTDQSDNLDTVHVMQAVQRAPLGAYIYDAHSTGMLRYMQLVERKRLDLTIELVQSATVETDLERDLRAGRTILFLKQKYGARFRDKYFYVPQDGLWRIIHADPKELLKHTPTFVSAVEWLRANHEGGSVITGPYADAALRDLGVAGVLPAVKEEQDAAGVVRVPPELRERVGDVQRVYERAGSEETRAVLERYDVRYLVFVKGFPQEFTGDTLALPAHGRYRSQERLYRIAFENEQTLIYEVLR